MNIPRLQARRTREQLQLSDRRISANDLFDLILAETGDRREAEKAARDLLAAELRAGVEPL